MSTQAVPYNSRLVSCPACNAPKGEDCIGLIVPNYGPHVERYHKARAYLNHPSNQPATQSCDNPIPDKVLNAALAAGQTEYQRLYQFIHDPRVVRMVSAVVESALEVARPLIAAQALQETAEAFGENQMIREGDVKEWMLDRAWQIERGQRMHAPRTASCAPGCTLNSNHQGDCND